MPSESGGTDIKRESAEVRAVPRDTKRVNSPVTEPPEGKKCLYLLLSHGRTVTGICMFGAGSYGSMLGEINGILEETIKVMKWSQRSQDRTIEIQERHIDLLESEIRHLKYRSKAINQGVWLALLSTVVLGLGIILAVVV